MAPRDIALFFFINIFLMSSSSALVSRGIYEEVDVSNLQYSRITVTYDLPSSYLSHLTEQELVDKCEGLSTIEHGTCSVSLQASQGKVVFNMLEPATLSIKDLKIDNSYIKMLFYYKYYPKQFRLASGIQVINNNRKLKIKFPTHTTLLETVIDTPHISEFMVSGEAQTISVPIERDTYVLGEAIAIPELQGLVCVAAILDNDDVKIVSLSEGCRRFQLGTSHSLLSAGSYYLYIIVLTSRGIKAAKLPITLESSGFSLDLRIDKDEIFLGQSFTVYVSSPDASIDHCNIKIINSNGIIVDSMRDLPECDSIIVGTSGGAWSPGNYVVRVDAYADTRHSLSTANFRLKSAGFSSSELKTTKDSYYPGEEVTVFTDTIGDFCSYTIYNQESIPVAEATSVGCDIVTLKLDETLPSGSYEIRTKVYRNSRLYSMSSKGIQIKKWEPTVRSIQERLCNNGFLYMIGEKFPCISHGALCMPSSTSKPLCLCFDNTATPVSFCRYGERCYNGECRQDPDIKTPYTIVYYNGRCYAKRGAETLRCIEMGEICTGNCVCLDHKTKAPIQHCSVGESCTPDGCKPSVLRFEVTGIYSGDKTQEDSDKPYLYMDKLKSGDAVVIWRGYLRYKDQLLDLASLEDIEIRGILQKQDAINVEKSYLGEKEGWEFRAYYKGRFAPGKYDTFLIIKYREDVHVLRTEVEVWYPRVESRLNIEFKSITPDKISFKQLKSSVGIKIRVKVTDKSGKVLSDRDLSPLAFDVKLGEYRPIAITAKFEALIGQWIITATFREKEPQSCDNLEISVEEFGRFGKKATRVEVSDTIPLSMRIIKVVPGTTDENPLYYLLVTTGFDMDIYLQLEGDTEGLGKDSFRIWIGGREIASDKIAYATSTLEGYRIHIKNIRLCPNPPAAGTAQKIKVIAQGRQRTVTDTIYVEIKKNPGDYTVRREVGC